MAINPVSVNVENNSNKYNKTAPKTVAFGNFNPVISMMDGIDKGGFAASFIVQDMLGMAVPRTVTGLTRNSDQTGESNKGYAHLVAIRELLSGPSTFAIPAMMLWGIKKRFGRANNVPVNFIKGFNDHFADITEKNSKILNNQQELKNTFYKNIAKNLLESSTTNWKKDGTIEHYLVGEELDKEVEKFTNKLIAIDKAPKKYFWNRSETNSKGEKFAKALKGEFVEDFVELRKTHSDNPSNKLFKAWFTVKDEIINTEHQKHKQLETKVGSFIDYLMDYSDDAVKSVTTKFKPGEQKIRSFVENFGHKRAGSRFLANIGMTAAVISFFTIIPKLYNSKDGKNPALAGLTPEHQPHQPSNKKEGK